MTRQISPRGIYLEGSANIVWTNLVQSVLDKLVKAGKLTSVDQVGRAEYWLDNITYELTVKCNVCGGVILLTIPIHKWGWKN